MSKNTINDFEKDFEDLIRKYMKHVKGGQIYLKSLEVILSICVAACNRMGKLDGFKEGVLSDVSHIVDNYLHSVHIMNSRRDKNV